VTAPPPTLPAEEAPRFRLPRRMSVRRLAAALAEAGYAVPSTHAVRREDVYFDTQDGRLHRAGVRLRRRDRPPVWQALERGWQTAEEPATAEDAPEVGAAAAAAGPIAGGRLLLPQATVRLTGRLLSVRTPVGVDLELEVGRCSYASPHGGTVVAGPRVAVVEVPSALPAEAQHLGAVLRDLVGLRRLADDPLAGALRTLALPLPGAPVPDELRLSGDDTMATAAGKVLARQAFKMRANTAGTLDDRDLEFLHDLRVATRRARSALRLFVPLYGESRCAELRGELGWVAERLGAVRDLDVHLERLHDELARAGAAPGRDAGLAAALQDRRGPALAELRKALRSPRYDVLVRALSTMTADAASAPEASTAAPAVEVAPVLIAKAARRVRRWGEQIGAQASEGDLHRLRILFKRLRYTCEFFADLFGEEFRAAVARVVPFQDCLGALQDAVVALRVLAGHAETVAAAGRPAVDDMLVLGALMQVQREVVARQRGELERLWAALPRILKALVAPLPPGGSDDSSASGAAPRLSGSTAAPGAAAGHRRGSRRTPPPR
jgi:CHAD domain-containing protein